MRYAKNHILDLRAWINYLVEVGSISFVIVYFRPVSTLSNIMQDVFVSVGLWVLLLGYSFLKKKIRQYLMIIHVHQKVKQKTIIIKWQLKFYLTSFRHNNSFIGTKAPRKCEERKSVFFWLQVWKHEILFDLIFFEKNSLSWMYTPIILVLVFRICFHQDNSPVFSN